MGKKDLSVSRVLRSKAQAKRYYNRLSSFYDLLSGRSEYRANEIGLNHLAIKSDDSVLEIGFGTGKILNEILAREEYTGRLYGIDISEGMVDKARTRLGDKASRAELFCGDATTLLFGSNQFHKIYMSFTLELFDTPEIPLVLEECRRVLRDQGQICVIAMSKRKVNTMVRIYEVFHRIFPVRIDCRPILTQQFLQNSRFRIIENVEYNIAGLPVDIIIAEKTNS